ncbi:MAG: hypothetical protein L3J39_11730 [Verrucomicrobiales bacterium]|nr:hypothetical protein [Verrucomicrobiales bacterium]
MTTNTRSYSIRTCLLLLPLTLLLSCEKNEAPTDHSQQTIDATIELLHHDDKGLTVAQSTKLDHLGQSFELAGIDLRILEHWQHAQALPQSDNQSKKENHAVELGWNISAADTSAPKESQWIYQSNQDGPSGTLPGIELQVRMLPPGSQPTAPDQWQQSPKDTVQFEREGSFVSIPKVGGDIFPNWIVQEIKTYQHALLEENGDIKESDDGDFANRAIEITLSSTEGTIERHLCFLDHPELTKGIHPELLPATRLKGSSASQSRLTARDPIKILGNSKNRLMLSSDSKNPKQLNAFTWDDKKQQFKTHALTSLPQTLKIGDQSITVLQHRNHARSVVKWQKVAASTANSQLAKNKDAEDNTVTPALLITWLENNHHQKAVLPLNRATPVLIQGKFQTFRYREGDCCATSTDTDLEKK